MGWIARTVVRITASLIVAAALLWAASMAAVLLWSSLDQARRADSIVVLGAAQYDGRPSPVLKARLDHGIELWKKKMSPLLVLTGGTGPGDTTSEAAVGRAYARKQGVPNNAMLLENTGTTTRESMLAVADSLEKRGMTTAILVSDPFHMLRLRIMGGRFGLKVYTSPTRTSPISPNSETRWQYILSESWKAPLAFFFERKT